MLYAKLCPIFLQFWQTAGFIVTDFYPHMPIGKVWIYRLLFVF